MPNYKTSSWTIGRRKRENLASKVSHLVPQLVVRLTNHKGETLQVAMGGTAIERSMVNMGSIAVYHVKPVISTDYQLGEKTTIFAIHVQNAITGRSWVVHRRYSDFMMLRGLITTHFKLYGDAFPRIASLVDDLFFPKKHKFRHIINKVVEHRCDAFLEYLMGLHRLLISQDYLMRRDISPLGWSILRGFLGSAIVQDPSHTAYSCLRPFLPIELHPADRTPMNQCGSLTTVFEDDAEDVVEIEALEPEAAANDARFEDSMSHDVIDGEEMTRMLEIVDRRRSHKYARNRRVLLFLRKDGWSEGIAATDFVSDAEDVPQYTPRSRDYVHTEKKDVRANEMLRPLEFVVATKPI